VPSINGITRSLQANNIDEHLIGELIGEGDLVNVIGRMDERLDREAKYRVLDACACCTKTSKARDKQCKAYGKAMAGKSLEEKIAGLAGDMNFGCVTLNDDRTLTVSFCWIIDDKRYCSCGSTRNISVAGRPSKDKKTVNQDRIIPLSYCYCCAGHFRYHLQNALGIKLKTKEIISSPINSRGEKPCEFILEVVD